MAGVEGGLVYASLRCFCLNLRADSGKAENAEGDRQDSSERCSRSWRAGFGCDGCNATLALPGCGGGEKDNAVPDWVSQTTHFTAVFHDCLIIIHLICLFRN